MPEIPHPLTAASRNRFWFRVFGTGPACRSLRQLDHVHDAELMLSLVRTVVEAGSLAVDTVLNDALYRMGFIRLTENARERLRTPLDRALQEGLLVRGKEGLEPGRKAFERPRPST